MLQLWWLWHCYYMHSMQGSLPTMCSNWAMHSTPLLGASRTACPTALSLQPSLPIKLLVSLPSMPQQASPAATCPTCRYLQALPCRCCCCQDKWAVFQLSISSWPAGFTCSSRQHQHHNPRLKCTQTHLHIHWWPRPGLPGFHLCLGSLSAAQLLKHTKQQQQQS